jgi:hypothetical protein
VKIKSGALGIVVLAVILGGVGITMMFNLWQTESSKVPVTFQEGEFTGQYNPADIRGSYSFGDISELFAIPMADLVTAFSLEDVADPADYQLKDVEADFFLTDGMVGVASVRTFVSLYTGLPYWLDETIYLPDAAVAVLRDRAVLTAEQAAFLDAHGINPTGEGFLEPAMQMEECTEDTENMETVAGEVKGKTTFRELLDLGLPEADIRAVVGGELPALTSKVREYAVAQGLDFAAVKEELQARLDALP